MKNLTKRQYTIARLITLGNSEKEIADQLFVSYDTVHTHTYHIRKKLGARSAVDIARQFILNLDDPKKYFAALLFFALQFNTVFTAPPVELRKPVRTASRSRVCKAPVGRIKFV